MAVTSAGRLSKVFGLGVQDAGASFKSTGEHSERVYIGPSFSQNWVAVKELKLSYCIGETLLITIYTHYGILI